MFGDDDEETAAPAPYVVDLTGATVYVPIAATAEPNDRARFKKELEQCPDDENDDEVVAGNFGSAYFAELERTAKKPTVTRATPPPATASAAKKVARPQGLGLGMSYDPNTISVGCRVIITGGGHSGEGVVTGPKDGTGMFAVRLANSDGRIVSVHDRNIALHTLPQGGTAPKRRRDTDQTAAPGAEEPPPTWASLPGLIVKVNDASSAAILCGSVTLSPAKSCAIARISSAASSDCRCTRP